MTSTTYTGPQRLAAEVIGSGLLVATVVGSGIMAEKLAGGNVAVALLGNTIPTAAILYVLITMLGPVSGGHFNPVVTLEQRARTWTLICRRITVRTRT
jgi:glycerol uptake facilitator-like aquaporin